MSITSREQICECLKRVEKRINSLLRACHLVQHEVALYRLASLFSAILQMSVDLAYVICREVNPVQCNTIDSVIDTLRSIGIIRGDSERALRELENMLNTVSRLAGPSLALYIHENLDRAIELALTYTHDIIRFLDEHCKPRFSIQ